ncbi:MAG TPA: glycerol-3-phosphate 1-O-acyltransferase PlsY [Gallionella sp.]|nr:glycerol-3-phosphate 1-O-acyltransferase PlsY [Gallionella sp.]
MLTVVFIVAAYLLGSISFALITSKLFNLPDPRTYGSGNPGATNVLRSGKKAAAALTLIGDAAKGWLAVWVAIRYSQPGEQFLMLPAAVAIAVFVGHLYPVFLRFRGGKGVATALGVLLALNIMVGLGGLATWLIMAFMFRYSSLAALAAAVATPIYAFLLGLPQEWVLACGILSLLLIWRHKSNIRNLLAGKETKIGSKKPA